VTASEHKKIQLPYGKMIFQLIVALLGLDGIVLSAAQGVGTVRSHLSVADQQIAIAWWQYGAQMSQVWLTRFHVSHLPHGPARVLTFSCLLSQRAPACGESTPVLATPRLQSVQKSYSVLNVCSCGACSA
jgi:hypothetical protein